MGIFKNILGRARKAHGKVQGVVGKIQASKERSLDNAIAAEKERVVFRKKQRSLEKLRRTALPKGGQSSGRPLSNIGNFLPPEPKKKKKGQDNFNIFKGL